MSIIRIEKTENYSVIANQPINDSNLSWGARGMLAYLLSKPNHWQVRMSDLEQQSPAGEHATRTIVKELETAGYMWRTRTKDKEGKFNWITTVFETPRKQVTPEKTIPQFSTDGLSTHGSSTDGKVPDIVNTELVNTESLTRQAAPAPTRKPEKKGDFVDLMLMTEQGRNGKADLGFLHEHLRPLGEAFVHAAGSNHQPARHEQSKWVKVLKEWYELHYTPGQIERAVEKMRREGLTIGGPESVTKTARDVNGKPLVEDGRIDIY